jgi:hypothetical protein
MRGRLSTVDLLIETACFVKKVKNIFNIERSKNKEINRSEPSSSVRLPWSKACGLYYKCFAIVIYDHRLRFSLHCTLQS